MAYKPFASVEVWNEIEREYAATKKAEAEKEAQSQKESQQGRSDKPLTDAMMKGMIPMFVEKVDPPDHKCGNCMMRVMEAGKQSCTIVKGGISFANGTCSYWAPGPAATAEKIHDDRMSYALSGYVEVPEGSVINCSSCRFFERKDAGVGHCTLWNGSVKDAQCCMAWDAPNAKTPDEGAGGK